MGTTAWGRKRQGLRFSWKRTAGSGIACHGLSTSHSLLSILSHVLWLCLKLKLYSEMVICFTPLLSENTNPVGSKGSHAYFY